MVEVDFKRDYYADLEIQNGADAENINKQFRQLARDYHPDRNPGKEAELLPKFQAVQVAHEILGNQWERANYDFERAKLTAPSTFKDQSTTDIHRETARYVSRSHRHPWTTRKHAHDDGPDTNHVDPIDVGWKRTKMNSLTNLSDQKEAFMERPMKTSGSNLKIRFDTISQDRSTGEEALLLCALMGRTNNLSRPKERELGEVKKTDSSQARRMPTVPSHRQVGESDIDMNDSITLEYYTQLTAFKASRAPETLIFPQDVSPEHRRVIYTLAHHLGLMHTTYGSGEQRKIHVQRPAPRSKINPLSSAVSDDYSMRQQHAVPMFPDHSNLPFDHDPNDVHNTGPSYSVNHQVMPTNRTLLNEEENEEMHDFFSTFDSAMGIPEERSLENIDALILRSTKEIEKRRLKEQRLSQLLRDRQADRNATHGVPRKLAEDLYDLKPQTVFTSDKSRISELKSGSTRRWYNGQHVLEEPNSDDDFNPADKSNTQHVHRSSGTRKLPESTTTTPWPKMEQRSKRLPGVNRTSDVLRPALANQHTSRTFRSPHRCSKCNTSFETTDELKRDIALHEGMYVCSIPSCIHYTNGFRTIAELRRHNTAHAAENGDLLYCEEPSQHEVSVADQRTKRKRIDVDFWT